MHVSLKNRLGYSFILMIFNVAQVYTNDKYKAI